ncbi:MAG: hypothetical protein AB8I08_13210 [Sandaracinaceae bacterium]
MNQRSLATLTCLALLAGCAAKAGLPTSDEGDDPFKRDSAPLSRDGRWEPPTATRSVGDALDGTYEAAPYWNPSRCAGGHLPGTAQLGTYLTGRFAGASRFEGYNCRRNTADPSRMSMHGTGRALDVYVPLSSGDADNGLGDPIANWLIENADALGVQFIIWDRTKWNVSYSGRKDRSYGGSHPHHDHLHIELNARGAAGDLAWYRSGGESPPDAMPTPGEDIDPRCNDTCAYAGDGECDDASAGGTGWCPTGTDCSDCAPRAIPVDEPVGSSMFPHAGITQEGMSIPYAGLDNATLAGTGMGSTEPYGDRVTHEGREYVRGTISHFGGPDDRWVTTTETGTITGERLRSLNAPMNPSDATVASRPEDFYYVAMRWRYAPLGKSWYRGRRVLIVNPATGRAVVVRPLDWGPNIRTRRIVDVSPQAERDLGASTDDTVLVAWAPAGTPLGRVDVSSTAPAPGPTPTPAAEGCSDTCRYANDGECDDGGPGASYAACALGTDCGDCGPRSGDTRTPPPPPEPAASICSDTCTWANDGECDDGGFGAEYAGCALGTDCGDCGPREATSAGSTPAPTPSPAGDVGDLCSSAASCGGALSCRAAVSDPSLHCCVEGAQACGSGSDCCGYMDCISGVCQLRGSGRACLGNGDCASGTCSGSRCL